MFIYLIIGLLALIALLLFVISNKLNRLSTINERGMFFDARTEHQKALLDEALNELEQLKDGLSEIQMTMKNIQYVTDIIEKYKLPSKTERKQLDDISLNEEVWEGISRAQDQSHNI